MANLGIGFGKFLESIGQSGVRYGQQLSQEEKEKQEKLARAPIDKLNLERLRQEVERGRFAIDEKKNEAASKKSLQNKMKAFEKLMQDPEVIQETAKIAARDAGASVGQTEIRETLRPPTLGEQVGRLPGTEFEFPTDPAIQQQVTGLRNRFAESQEPALEQEEFKRKQTAAIDLQELRGKQSMDLEAFKSAEKKQIQEMKKDAQSGKKKQSQQDINNGIEAVITLAEGVKPHGRIIGFVDKLGKWSGFNPNLSSLDNTAGLLAGQVAKKIGGESGRLTDQDRIYALRVMPKSIDTKQEREIKLAVLKTFQDPDVTGETIRSKLIEAMSGLNKFDSTKYEILDEEGNPVGKDEDTSPSEKAKSFRTKYIY